MTGVQTCALPIWFTKVRVNGVDRTDELKAYVKEHGYLPPVSEEELKKIEPSWKQTFTNSQYILNMFPDYLPNTYLQYYLLSNYIVEHEDPNYTRANEVMDGREKHIFDTVNEYKKTGKMDVDQFMDMHGEFIVDVAMSLAYDQKRRYLVMVKNDGSIPNLPKDAMVEVPAYITSKGPEPVRVGTIKPFYKGLIEQQNACEQMLCEAAIENSYEKALMAFTMNKTVPSAMTAKKILDDMIEANKEYWPELK